MESFIIPVHVTAGIVAMVLGAWQLLRRKGGNTHKITGYLYALSMVIVSGSSFFLYRFSGGFGGLHVLSVITLISITVAIFSVRTRTKRGIRIHQICMAYTYVGLWSAAASQIVGRLTPWPDHISIPTTIATIMVAGTLLIIWSLKRSSRTITQGYS